MNKIRLWFAKTVYENQFVRLKKLNEDKIVGIKLDNSIQNAYVEYVCKECFKQNNLGENVSYEQKGIYTIVERCVPRVTPHEIMC